MILVNEFITLDDINSTFLKYGAVNSFYECDTMHETRYDKLMATRPELAMMLAVKGMLAKNPTQKHQLRRLKIYAGAEHKNAAQKPQAWVE